MTQHCEADSQHDHCSKPDLRGLDRLGQGSCPSPTKQEVTEMGYELQQVKSSSHICHYLTDDDFVTVGLCLLLLQIQISGFTPTEMAITIKGADSIKGTAGGTT